VVVASQRGPHKFVHVLGGRMEKRAFRRLMQATVLPPPTEPDPLRRLVHRTAPIAA
jgi:hypothetical protein